MLKSIPHSVSCLGVKRTTIKDVAEAAGVSPATVSRVYSADGSASSEVRARVREAADRLGYRPNVMARSLTQSRTDLFALVVGSLENPFDAKLVETLSRALSGAGKRLLLIPAGDEVDDPGTLVALDYQTDGVIVAAGHMSRTSSERFARLGVPVILFGRVLNAPGVDSILADNFDSARRVGRLFARHGRKRITILRKAARTFSDDGREAGLVAGLAGDEDVRVVSSHESDAFESAASFLAEADPPDAVFCVNDVLALSVLEAARSLGLSVPRDLAVVGFDDIPIASSPSYSLTTNHLSVDQIAHWIVQRLQARLQSPDLPVVVKRIDTALTIRSTTPQNSIAQEQPIPAKG